MSMERVTFRAPGEQISAVERCVANGEFPNKSEALRAMLRDWVDENDGPNRRRQDRREYLRTDGGRSVRTFRSASERPTVSYGPGDPATDRWVLAVSCEGGRVEIEVDEETMYDLWLEVKNVPWPTRDDDTGRLEREVVHLATDANEEMLRDALAVLRGER